MFLDQVASVCPTLGGIQAGFIFLLVLFISKLCLSMVRGSQQPPGPLTNWLPIVGSLPLLFSRPSHLMMTSMAEKYGKIFRLKLGSTTLVVISDPKLLQHTFNREVLTGRNIPAMMDVMDKLGIIHAEGGLWKNQRHFVHQVLRSLGMVRTTTNKIKFEEKASVVIIDLLKELESTKGQPIDIDEPLSYTISSIFFSSVVGKTFARDDQQLLTVIRDSHECFKIIESISIANFIPIFARLPKFKKILNTIFDNKAKFIQYVRPFIQEHHQDLDAGNPRDLIDSYLVEMDKDSKNGQSTYFTEIQLFSVLGDLFSAGLETTATTIRWLLLALINFPEIQKKIHDELDSIIGHQRAPSLDDRNLLPYLEATIQEGFRFSSILPMGVGHNPTEDTTIDGYTIPKEATVVGLFWKFNRDPKFWKNPNAFDPTNHLDNNGSLVKSRNLMPFSTGRRMCLGEDVAQNEIFLILSNLLQKFKIQGEDNVTVPNLDDCMTGFLRTPLFFKIRAISRETGI